VQPNRRLPNATVLDVIHEVDEEEAAAALEEERERFAAVPLKKPRFEEEEEALMDVRTMVFGMGASGDLRIG
jgi:hypothetical protein